MESPILITGGAGFIGSCLVRQLIPSAAAPIIVLDKLTYAGNLDSLVAVENDPHYTFVQGDIADQPLVSQLLTKYQPGAVIHLAAESHVDRSIDGPAEFIETNVVGTWQLLDTCHQYWKDLSPNAQSAFRFVHVSTDEVYGSLGATGHFTETTRYQPNSPYAASKAAADHFVRAYHHTFGLPVLTTNCSNNYGPYQFPEKLIPLMISKAVAGEPLPVYGDGSNVRDWLHVEDHCRALQHVLQKGQPGRVYNIGGNSERTNLEVVQTICAVVDKRTESNHDCSKLITFVTDRPGHDQRYAIDCTRLTSELDWHPQYEFESGLEQTIQWYLDNCDWSQRVLDGSYRGQRLGTNR
ncbi:MAG: dTDP-glucose 4,6-dehydratase [Planctomycetota bacterium]|nr:dTDP-glucose 4,6-dehydratase [Planctomycetota bacterium]